MAHEVVPYSFQSPSLPPDHQAQWHRPTPGYCGVVITFEPQHMQFLSTKIETWFENCDEVIWVAGDYSEKQNQGFIILEWDNCEIPELFLNILRSEDIIDSFSTYFREETQSLMESWGEMRS